MLRACVIHDEPRLEIIESIKNEVHITDVIFNVSGIHIVDARFDLDGRIHTTKLSLRGYRLGKILLDVGFVEKGLPLEIRQFDKIAVDHAHESNAGTDNLICSDGPKRSEAENQDA